MDKKISVIVPIYNVEKYLEKCVNSIISQSYRNLEIILVDDGSTDKCGEICDSLKETDDRIIVVHQSNGGLSAARNTGLKICTGDYIAFVDSDDWVDVDLYKKCMDQMNADIDLIVFDYLQVKNDRFVIDDFSKSELINNKVALERLILDEIHSFAWNKIYSRHLFDNIFFPIGKNYEDVYIMHNIFMKCNNIKIFQYIGYYYLQRENSIVYTKSIKNELDFFYGTYTRYLDIVNSEFNNLSRHVYSRLIERLLSLYQDFSKGKFNHESNAEKLIDEAKKVCLEIKEQNFESYMPLHIRIKYECFKLSKPFYLFASKYFNNPTGQKLIYDFINFIKNKKRYQRKNYDKSIFLMGMPEYDNLGDIAIAYAEIEFLKKNCSEYDLYVFSEKEVLSNINRIKKMIGKNDVILLQGGGNFSNLYPDQQNIRKKIINNFRNNKIVLFPQTIYFSKDDLGDKELRKCQKLYSKNRNVNIFAREKVSYDYFSDNFKFLNISVIPDIVFTLDETRNEIRDGALLCLRSDKESNLTIDDLIIIRDALRSKYDKITITDTITSKDDVVKIDNYRSLLEKKWLDFSKAEIVVTDRLHGVIFAAITSTPCIIFGNNNHKVLGIYEWLKRFDYIKYCDDISKLDTILEQLSKTNYSKWNSQAYNSYFEKLLSTIND